MQKITMWYQNKKAQNQGTTIDTALHYTKWLHPADTVEFTEKQENKAYTYEIYTDGSKGDFGVGSGIAIFIENKLSHHLQYKLHDRCSNNQAEQIAILKALEKIESHGNLENKQKNSRNLHR